MVVGAFLQDGEKQGGGMEIPGLCGQSGVENKPGNVKWPAPVGINAQPERVRAVYLAARANQVVEAEDLKRWI